MSGTHGGGRVRVEDWEIEMAKGIARKFRLSDDDLAAHLLMRVVELKVKKRRGIQNWQAYLAQSLYNTAKNFIRHEDVRRRRLAALDPEQAGEENRPMSPERSLAAPDEMVDLRLDVGKVFKALTPEMQQLWLLLVAHEGNTSALARELRRPRKTVEYRVQKLKNLLATRGIG